MPRKNTPKSDAAEAEEGAPEATDSSNNANDTSSHIEPVLGAIASLRADLEGFKAAICQTIEAKTAAATAELRRDLADLKTENDAALASLRTKMEVNAQSIKELADATSTSSDTVRGLERVVETLQEQVSTLTEKCIDLEGRSKRQNLRVAGLREGREDGRDGRELAALLLKEALDLDELPLIDRAHRALRRRQGDDEPPRHFIIRVHYSHTFEKIMKKVISTREISFQGQKIHIFRDLPQEVAKRQAAFTTVRKLLRDKPGVRYGLLYPAKLRLSHDGTEKFFTDPDEARRYVARYLEEAGSGRK
ncbi:unnamed protein product [Knipowitschia caucasica]|uniref:Transposase element L1Md-A101/L1Md-A102/L1Md-A2 n=1 Tax=Knipowitschia caucasica TaxID=637954 RepID=A0AAV2KAS5_KNICA